MAEVPEEELRAEHHERMAAELLAERPGLRSDGMLAAQAHAALAQSLRLKEIWAELVNLADR